MSKKSLVLVIIQLASFLFFGLVGDLFATSYWLVFQVIGLVIGLWGIFAMKLGNFNMQPEVKAHAIMVSSGPYRVIRNPMYFGLLLFFGASVLANFSLLRFTVFLILAIVLLLKIIMEERFLEQKFGQVYLEYKVKTHRLIPFIF